LAGCRHRILAVVEQIAGVLDGLAFALVHDVDDDRLEEQEAERGELDFKRQTLRAPQTLVGPEANVAILVVIQILEKIRQIVAGRLERLGRQRLGAAVDVGKVETFGWWGRGRRASGALAHQSSPLGLCRHPPAAQDSAAFEISQHYGSVVGMIR